MIASKVYKEKNFTSFKLSVPLDYKQHSSALNKSIKQSETSVIAAEYLNMKSQEYNL